MSPRAIKIARACTITKQVSFVFVSLQIPFPSFLTAKYIIRCHGGEAEALRQGAAGAVRGNAEAIAGHRDGKAGALRVGAAEAAQGNAEAVIIRRTNATQMLYTKR